MISSETISTSMRALSASFLLLMPVVCVLGSEVRGLPELGESLTLTGPKELLMVAAGQVYPHQAMTFDGLAFDLAVGADQRVAYIATSDPGFRTAEGISVASTLRDVLAAGAKTAVAEDGWAYRAALPSGWSAAFVSGPGMTDRPLQAGVTVRWLFKRK